jgi:hypothetical protein
MSWRFGGRRCSHSVRYPRIADADSGAGADSLSRLEGPRRLCILLFNLWSDMHLNEPARLHLHCSSTALLHLDCSSYVSGSAPRSCHICATQATISMTRRKLSCISALMTITPRRVTSAPIVDYDLFFETILPWVYL